MPSCSKRREIRARGCTRASGRGSYRMSDSAANVVADVRFELAFDRGKYNLKIARGVGMPAHRLVVSDQSAIFAQDSYEGEAKPMEVNVLKTGPGRFQSATQVFQIDIVRYTAGCLSAEQLDKQPVKIERASGAHVRGSYEHPNGAKAEFEASSDVAYNVVHMESYENTPTGHAGWGGDLDWGRDGPVWYVRKAAVRRFARGQTLDRQEWVYDEFHANPRLAPELFTLAAFNLNAGGSVVDRRSGEAKIHPVNPAAVAETRLDTMVRQMEEMPLRGPPPPPRPVSKTMLIVAVNVVAAVLILSAWCLWYLFRQRRYVANKPQLAGR